MALYSTTKFMKDVPSTPQVMYQCLQKSVSRLTGSQITKVNFNTRYKLEWDNLDSEAFNALITNELFMYNMEEKTSEDNINFLCRCLKRATTAAVPSKVIKLKGHKFKASPTVLHLLKIFKEKYQLWKNYSHIFPSNFLQMVPV